MRKAPNLAVLEQWRARVDALPGSSDGYRANLHQHTQAFVWWLMAELAIEADAEGRLSWIAPGERNEDPATVLEQALLDGETFWVELYLLDRAKRSPSKQLLATLTCSLKRAYECFAEHPSCSVIPTEIRNPLAGDENQHPLTESYLRDAGFLGSTLATRRFDLAAFLRQVCRARNLTSLACAAWRKERIALSVIRSLHKSVDQLLLIEDERVAGTLGAILCFDTSVVKPYLQSLVVPGATVTDVRSRVYTLRQFYLWLAEEGLTEFDPDTIRNPLATADTGPRPPKPPKPTKPCKKAGLPDSRSNPAAGSETSRAGNSSNPLPEVRKLRPILPKRVATEIAPKQRKPKPAQAVITVGPDTPVVVPPPTFSKPQRHAVYRLNAETRAVLFDRRDHCLTELIRTLPAGTSSAIVGELMIGDLNRETGVLELGRNVEGGQAVVLSVDLARSIGEYRDVLQSSPLGAELSVWEARAPLFVSLDGGKLFVDECENYPNMQNYIRARNRFFTFLMSGKKLSFRDAVEWKNVRFRNELQTLQVRYPDKPNVVELSAMVRTYDQSARLVQLNNYWLDPSAPLLLGCDGGFLTADER